MTELRRRGGGGDTDNSDNVSDKVTAGATGAPPEGGLQVR